MKVLLLHPEDSLQSLQRREWDLIVDLGRAPDAIYEEWGRRAACQVFSIYGFAREIIDLYCVRELLQIGSGQVIDRCGIDWWDVLAMEIVRDLMRLPLVQRLSDELPNDCQLFANRPDPLATALAYLRNTRLTIQQTGLQSLKSRAQCCKRTFSQLNRRQLAQVLEDKFDATHAIRRRLSSPHHSTGEPVTLLPSAYINVTRTALSYATLSPQHKFLLVITRSGARPQSLPPNVACVSLSPYFCKPDKIEIASLRKAWHRLRRILVSAAEFQLADGLGILATIPRLLPWGIALRDAWNRLFDSENVIACFSADDSNPPSSIPLMLARQRSITTLACHHGALDYQAAIKPLRADFYLAKTELERDYLRRVCHMNPDKIIAAKLDSPTFLPLSDRIRAPWLVFFTEPYGTAGWHVDEVYRDLLPTLWSLAQSCSLKLVFKLHPFENEKSHRRILRRHLGERERDVKVIEGPPREQIWGNARFALTVQSSTALACAARGIPVFLCAWLRDPFSGYVEQFTRFNVGQVLSSSAQIAEIPRLLEAKNQTLNQRAGLAGTIECENLENLISGFAGRPPLMGTHAG